MTILLTIKFLAKTGEKEKTRACCTVCLETRQLMLYCLLVFLFLSWLMRQRLMNSQVIVHLDKHYQKRMHIFHIAQPFVHLVNCLFCQMKLCLV